MVIVYWYEEVTYSDLVVTYLSHPDVMYEGVAVHYEEDLVVDTAADGDLYDANNVEGHTVRVSDKAVGVGEYEDVITAASNNEEAINRQTQVFNRYDERTSGVGGAAGAGAGGVESEITHDC
jgi:hypothetical protein